MIHANEQNFCNQSRMQARDIEARYFSKSCYGHLPQNPCSWWNIRRLSFHWINLSTNIKTCLRQGRNKWTRGPGQSRDQCRISPTLPPKMLRRAPLMVIYKKKLCNAISRGRMDFKTEYSNCRHNFGRTRPVARFWGLVGKIHFYGGRIFVLSYVLKQIFLSTTKFGAQKDLGVTTPECPPCLQAWAELSPESLPLGASCLCRRLDILKIYS